MMATTEKSIELDGDDCAVSRKAALLHVRLTRLLGVTVMLLVLLMVFYLVYLHVRLVKLEQLQCVAEATRTSVVTTTNEDDDDDDDDADDDDITDKAERKMLLWSSSSSAAAAVGTGRASRVRRTAESSGRRPQPRRRRDDVACHLQFHLRHHPPNELRQSGRRVYLSNGEYEPAFGFRLTRGREEEPFVYKNWKVEHWAENSRLFRYNHNSGRLTIEAKGIYYIYAQLLYHNAATRSSFTVMVDNETFLQCWTSVDAVSANTTSADNARYKTCHTAGITKLRRHQQIWINDLYGNYISTNTNSSFFGVLKLSPS